MGGGESSPRRNRYLKTSLHVVLLERAGSDSEGAVLFSYVDRNVEEYPAARDPVLAREEAVEVHLDKRAQECSAVGFLEKASRELLQWLLRNLFCDWVGVVAALGVGLVVVCGHSSVAIGLLASVFSSAFVLIHLPIRIRNLRPVSAAVLYPVNVAVL